MDATPSETELVEALQSYAADIDSVPTVRGMRNGGPYSPHNYKEAFGSWHDALRAADIQPTHGVDQDVSRAALLAELQAVNERTDRPPRRRDIEEHGEYQYPLYDDEFESFVSALQEAGIEPDEKQYRFSSVETPPEKRGSANIEKLRNEGPTPATELPQGISTNDRENGAWSFDMSSGSTRPADPIHYIDGEHAPELVIRRFFQQNPHVLEYRDPHGIKIDIKNHRPSWSDIGQEVVDELVADGVTTPASFENLVMVRLHESEPLRYCFDSSVASPVATVDLPFVDEDEGQRPVWGFPTDHEEIWRALGEDDGLLFSARPGVLTHYAPVANRVENRDVMTDLWVEYEDGVRAGGIERPWPYVVVGTDVREVTIPQEEFAEEVKADLTDAPVQLLGDDALGPFRNSYAGFDSYLRDREHLTEDGSDEIELTDDPSPQDVVDVLLQVTEDDLPVYAGSLALDELDRETRKTAFREAIYESYPGCAICGELFESPDGSFDLEPVHVLPKALDGPDVVQNGIGLCSRHRWAFDNGWFDIGVDYQITIREFPELEGYETLQVFDGEYLYLPSDEELQPHPHYIQQRNWALDRQPPA